MIRIAVTVCQAIRPKVQFSDVISCLRDSSVRLFNNLCVQFASNAQDFKNHLNSDT